MKRDMELKHSAPQAKFLEIGCRLAEVNVVPYIDTRAGECKKNISPNGNRTHRCRPTAPV